MSKSVISYIILLLLLCGGAYWLGTQQVEIVEKTVTTIKVDSVFVPNPSPIVITKPAESKIVYLAKYDTIRDSVLVYVPISDYTFRQDSLYEIKAKGYDVSLTSVKFFGTTQTTTTNTTISPKIKHWAVNARARASIIQQRAGFGVGANIEYANNGWTFGGGYEYNFNSAHSVAFYVERTLFKF